MIVPKKLPGRPYDIRKIVRIKSLDVRFAAFAESIVIFVREVFVCGRGA
jgi:hypothetical protein